MSSTGKNLLLRLRVNRRALLRRYDDDALHRLRVALRRLRSLLHHVDTAQAKALRRALGQLANTTNAARDWDTLASRARESLKPPDCRRLQPFLAQNRAAAHNLVLQMLRSDEWAQAMAQLDDCIDNGSLLPAGDSTVGKEIARARHAVRRAWCKVQSKDDNRHWHKLRLAIKQLRYTFDSVPRDSLDAPRSKTLKHCKRLQDLLGVWHDTVVHQQMVRDFASGVDRDAEEKLYEVLETWCLLMEREARDALDEARSFLAGNGSDLLER